MADFTNMIELFSDDIDSIEGHTQHIKRRKSKKILIN